MDFVVILVLKWENGFNSKRLMYDNTWSGASNLLLYSFTHRLAWPAAFFRRAQVRAHFLTRFFILQLCRTDLKDSKNEPKAFSLILGRPRVRSFPFDFTAALLARGGRLPKLSVRLEKIRARAKRICCVMNGAIDSAGQGPLTDRRHGTRESVTSAKGFLVLSFVPISTPWLDFPNNNPARQVCPSVEKYRDPFWRLWVCDREKTWRV